MAEKRAKLINLVLVILINRRLQRLHLQGCLLVSTLVDDYVDAGDARGFEKYKRPKTGIEKGFEQLGNFIGRVTRPPGAEGATLDGKPGFENRGVVTASPETKVKETTRMAGGFFSPQNFQRSGVPDATIMTGEQMRQSLTGDPGYTRFGSLDRPGTQAAKDTAAFNQRVKSDFFSPVKVDARSIAERREANVQSMRDEARSKRYTI